MLTRHAIDSGDYLTHFESRSQPWSLARITASLERTMRAKPASAGGTWVFAYGSLMWNPLVECERQEVATLAGWHRSFCLRMTVGRASPGRPGRMLALERGGSTHGIALKLPEASLPDELRRLWIREMVLGSYRPIWATIHLHSGRDTPAIAFVADETRPQFEPDATPAAVAPLIRDAAGCFGTNADYLLRLHAALSAHGLTDAYIETVAGMLQDSPA